MKPIFLEIESLEKKAAAMTFAQAQAKVLETLKADGWSVKDGLKVPYAQKQDVRLWFKPQAIWFSKGSDHNLQNARSMWLDVKKLADLPDHVISKGLLQKAQNWGKNASSKTAGWDGIRTDKDVMEVLKQDYPSVKWLMKDKGGVYGIAKNDYVVALYETKKEADGKWVYTKVMSGKMSPFQRPPEKFWELPEVKHSLSDERIQFEKSDAGMWRGASGIEQKLAGGYATNNRGRKLYDTKGYEAGDKDLWRMRDMRTKAKGDETKLVALARQMAKSIKDAEKAFRRADAAAQIFEGKLKDQIVGIFMDTAESLSDIKVARTELEKNLKRSLRKTEHPS